MHADILQAVIDSVRRRVEQGDCPTEPAHTVEVLENAVIALAASRPTDIDPGYGVATSIVDRARAIIVGVVGAAARRTTGDRKWLQGIADDVRDERATNMPSYLVLDCVIEALKGAASRPTDAGEPVKLIASALCRAAGMDPDAGPRTGYGWRNHEKDARDLLAALATPKPPVDEPWPGYTADQDRRRVETLAKLGLMLSVMAGGEAPEVTGFDAADLYGEVLMALAIEDAEDEDIALQDAMDDPEGHMLTGAPKPPVDEGMQERCAKVAECTFDDRPRSRVGHPSHMDWEDGYREGTRAAAAAIRNLTGDGAGA